MNRRHLLSFLSLAALASLSACDKDSKVFSDSDLSTERSTVIGTVTGLGDTGLVGVVVSASAVNDQGAPLADIPSQTSLSGKDGRYSMDLRPGLRWKITWQSPDYQTTDQGVSFDLGLRETKSLPAERLTYRYGTVAGRSLPGASVAIEGQDASTTADANGDFRIERVAPGPVEIVGVVRGKGFWRTTDSIRSESTSTVTGRQQLSTWKSFSKVTGSLVNQDGSPQAGAILSTMGGLVRDTTDVQGSFSFDALPADGQVVINVQRTTGAADRIVLSTPPQDSTWDLGQLPMSGSVTSAGLMIGNGLVVADPGDIVALPLLWKLLDSTRNVIGFVWDTTGTGSTAKAIRTWGPRLAGVRVGDRDRSISVWVCIAAPLSTGGFDTLWSQEATIRIMVRRKPTLLDSTLAPSFSRGSDTAWDAPLTLGLSAGTEGATVLWSRDSSRWTLWRDDDSIVLYDTTTLWAYSRAPGRLGSRMVRKTFDVREQTKPAMLDAKIVADYKLPQGSIHQFSACPELAANVTFVLDSGSTLHLPEGCDVTVANGATFEMRAGSNLIMGRGSYFYVGGSTTGKFVVKGRIGRRAKIVSADPANPAGYSNDYLIHLLSDAGGSRIEGLDLDGSSGTGIKLTNVEVDIVDSRIRNCKGAGILFAGTARPASDSGVRNDSISGCRWSVDASPFALGRIATNPGFDDTLRVYDGTDIAENNAWHRQKLPVRFEAAATVGVQSTLRLEAGLRLRMGSSAYFYVNDGVLSSAGTKLLPVRLEPATKSLGWGYNTGESGYGIRYTSTGTGELRWTEIVGTKGNGVYSDAPIGLWDCRLDSNQHAGVRFNASGAPSSDTSFARISAKGNRWSVVSSPMAFGLMSSCPGLSDSIFLANAGGVTDNATWHSQPVPVVVDAFDISIGGGANLAIDSGSTLVFTQGSYFYVGVGGGSLVVNGTPRSPVRFLSRTVAGWGYNPTSANGYAITFTTGTTAADLSNLVIQGAQANGIIFANTQKGVGKLVNVVVRQTATPTAGTFGLVLDNVADPTITNYAGTCDDGGTQKCP